jgi:hypothetical protein
MTDPSSDGAPLSDAGMNSDILRLTERSLQHWIERILREKDSILSNGVVAVGNKLALQQYLVGRSYERLGSLHLRFTLYCNDDQACKEFTKVTVRKLNSLASLYGAGSPSSHWTFLCVSLRRMGLIPSDGESIEAFSKLKLFKVMYTTINKVKTWAVGIDLQQFGHKSDLSVVTIEVASPKLKKALSNGAVHKMYLSGPGEGRIPMVPLNFILDDSLTVSRAVRLLVAKAAVTGDLILGAQSDFKHFDFVIRSVAKLLKATPSAGGDVFTERIRSFTVGKNDADLVHGLILQCDKTMNSLDIQEISNQLSAKKPGRYADMLLQVGPSLRDPTVGKWSKTGLSVYRILELYTKESSQLNIAVLLANTVPSMEASLGKTYFHGGNAKVSFADYMHDIRIVFDRVKIAKPQTSAPYKPLVLFRSVDLFDVGPAESVFKQDLPFDIVNRTICSTSTMLNPATSFLKVKSPCCMLMIHVPSDFTRMIAVKPVSRFPHEEEVIFSPDSVFTVYKRETMRHENHNIVVMSARPSMQQQKKGGSPRLDITALRGGTASARSRWKNTHLS